jgi:hypothetical protein
VAKWRSVIAAKNNGAGEIQIKSGDRPSRSEDAPIEIVKFVRNLAKMMVYRKIRKIHIRIFSLEIHISLMKDCKSCFTS